jgi:signal transduction histidine kinase
MDKSQIIISIYFVTTLLVLLFSFLFFVFIWYRRKRNKHIQERELLVMTYKNELLKTQLETQEQSYYQISQELHDNIGQLLSSTKVLLQVAILQSSGIHPSVITAEQTIDKAIKELRLLSKSFNKEWLEQFNLIENLQTEAKRVNIKGSLEAEFSSDCKSLLLETENQIMLFRIVQEALQNCIKHANANLIKIRVHQFDKHLQLTIQDNGKGFEIDEVINNSLGLKNMIHRTTLLGGRINWQTSEELGTIVTIDIPLQ